MGIFALSMHAFVLRFYHEGLNGQFVILWAILCYVKGTTRAWLPLAVEWVGCLGCAALLHPYLAIMAGLIALAALLRFGTYDPWRAAAGAGVVVGGGSLVLFVAGYIPQKLPDGVGEFGKASMNLLSLVIPYYSRLVPSLSTRQDMTGLQWDGCNFLGVGLWSLLALALLFASRQARLLLWRHKALTVVLACLALYAPSNRCWLGSVLVWDYDVPLLVRPFFDNARATGRFFWPVGYALMFFACTLVHRRFGRAGTIIVSIAAAGQLVDSTACWNVVTNSFARTLPKRHLDWSAWSSELVGASRVNMYPSYQCWTPDSGVPERVLEQEREIEFIAARSGARTNGGRAGRPTTDCAKEVEDRTSVARGNLRDGEAYVFFDPEFRAEILTVVGMGRCKEMGDAVVCRATSTGARSAR